MFLYSSLCIQSPCWIVMVTSGNPVGPGCFLFLYCGCGFLNDKLLYVWYSGLLVHHLFASIWFCFNGEILKRMQSWSMVQTSICSKWLQSMVQQNTNTWTSYIIDELWKLFSCFVSWGKANFCFRDSDFFFSNVTSYIISQAENIWADQSLCLWSWVVWQTNAKIKDQITLW